MNIKSSFVALALASVAAVGLAGAAQAAEAHRAPFGQTADGIAVEAITLTNQHGMSARIITYGAAASLPMWCSPTPTWPAI
jgi:aldose 1-epimerase